MPDDLSPDDALEAVRHLARALDRVASSAERTEAVVTHAWRALRWTIPLAWLCGAIALGTLALTLWGTVTLVREGRLHHERMQQEHQGPHR